MPEAAQPALTILTSKKSLSWFGAFCGTALAILSLGDEGSRKLDAWIFTEAEAADFAQQTQITRLQHEIAIATLRLKHAETPGQHAELKAELRWLEAQLRYMQCITDPRIDEQACNNLPMKEDD